MTARSPIALLKPPVSAELTRRTDTGGAQPGIALSDGSVLPSPMPWNVSYKGRMVDGGYQPENYQWGSVLTEKVNGKRVGRDPMKIDPEVLTATGHGPRRTSAIVAAIDMPVDDDIKEYRDIRRHCLECSSGNEAEVRRCPIYDCAAWAYRMGKNPHNPRRGKIPFPASGAGRPGVCASAPAMNDNHRGPRK